MPNRQLPGRKAIFLDRDGTINADAGYTWRIADWQFLPGAREALFSFKQAGWLVVVVSNQSGIGRGYYTESDLARLEDFVQKQLAAQSPGLAPVIDAWRHCPHLPEENCPCRKPKPGMILCAARELGIDLPSSWMLGDRPSDALAGLAAGCKAGYLGSARPGELPPELPVWPDLPAAARAILRDNSQKTLEYL